MSTIYILKVIKRIKYLGITFNLTFGDKTTSYDLIQRREKLQRVIINNSNPRLTQQFKISTPTLELIVVPLWR